jgi:hypothetical protein
MKSRKSRRAANPESKVAIPQIERFKAMAHELGLDEASTLDRAFSKLDAKKRTEQPKAKR